ncbi:leucine-rich repeats and immunoglobulin-like domains protein 1 [Corticium candelabrum]|uniref:leucine-rich repeats and immunoglobulin-like domains protein 1 n=1 Tax=Corticium candelabrum TaxID=121492 RepID=UPI002E25504B|nr:leucine-rich repeats and immunoglobulin-like domains protein 1 [Corticium candelabrum]
MTSGGSRTFLTTTTLVYGCLLCSPSSSLAVGSFPGLYNVTSNVYGLEGSSVSIYAERTARIPTQIQWEVETSLSEINLAVVQRYTVTRINSVILKNISVGFNLTRYRYILPGGFKSAWVTLRIGAVPGISNTKENLTVVAGEISRVPAVCLTLSGVPYPRLSLQHTSLQGEIIPISYELINYEPCFEIVSKVVSGILTATAQNCFGNATVDFKVVVQEKPSVWLDIDQREEAVCADESHDFVVGYRLNGFPHPQVAWYRSQSGKMTDNHTEYNSSHLTIKSVRGQDAGLYKIEVRNSLGSDEANFTLEVLQDCNTTNTSRTAEAFLWWYHVITVILSAVTGSVITTVVCLLRRRSRSSREADRLDTSKRHVVSSTSARQQEFETLSEMGGTIKPYATTHVSAVKAACKQDAYEVPLPIYHAPLEANKPVYDPVYRGYECMSLSDHIPISPQSDKSVRYSSIPSECTGFSCKQSTNLDRNVGARSM